MKTGACLAVLLVSLLQVGLLPESAAQQAFPSRPLRLLIPFPAGGASDTIGRTLGEQLSTQLGQPVVIDNRPGAAGRLATEMLVRATPDGHTLLVGGVGPVSIAPAVYPSLPYNVERDLLPITLVADIVNVMVAHPSSGATSVKQFIEWGKKRGELRFGNSGTGQLDHLAGELFQRMTGVRMTAVPYKGNAPALVDLVAGDLHALFGPYVVTGPHIKTGRVRALAITAPKRQALLPDIPTVAETLPGYAASNWNGIFAPAKTPRPAADRLFAEIGKAIKSPEVKSRQNAAGIEPVASASPADFVRYIREDTARWRAVVKQAGIRLD